MAKTVEQAQQAEDGAPPLMDWLQALGHDSPFERQPAALVWDKGVPPLMAAVRRLIPLLKDADRDIRVQAVATLGNLAAQAYWILPALRSALKETALNEDDDQVRNQAMRAVLMAGPQAASEVAALVDSLRHSLGVMRFHAAIVLGDLGPAAGPAVPALIHASLWDDDPAVRLEAAVALWKIDRSLKPRVLAALTQALADDNELLCWIAADCLGQMGSEARAAIPALRQARRRRLKIGLVRQALDLALEQLDPKTR